MKEKDFYEILEISKTATEDEIKTAYRRLAMKYHPDRNKNKTEKEIEALSDKLKDINVAYETLSDAKLRSEYDAIGTGSPFGSKFSSGSPFGSKFSSGSHFGSKFSSGSHFGSKFSSGSHFGGNFDNFGFDFEFVKKGNSTKSSVVKEVINYNVVCSLDELFLGAIKMIKIKRRTMRGTTEEKFMEVIIKPGYKFGTKFTFKDFGNYKNGAYQDICAVITENSAEIFKRSDNDLELDLEIGFSEMIDGFSKKIELPGNRSIEVNQDDFCKAGDFSVFPCYGMPVSKDPTRKGSLKIRLIVNIPKFNYTQRLGILRELSQ